MDALYSWFTFNCPALFQACLTVDISLVAASAELYLPILLFKDKGSVDEVVRHGKKLLPAVFIPVFIKLLERVAGVGYNVHAELFYLRSESRKSLRLRMVPGDLPLKTVKILVENAYGERISVEYPLTVIDGTVTLDVPVSDICDTRDLGNFPLHLVYYYITHAVTTGTRYSLEIPGLELIYASMPPDEPQPATGDVNGDGEVNVADVNAVIDMILSGHLLPAGDVNGDGEVNIADVNTLISIILN